MANDQIEVVLLKDGAGNYYLLSQDVLERARVSSDQAAALAERANSDTAGFLSADSASGNFFLDPANAALTPLGLFTISGTGLDALPNATAAEFLRKLIVA
jgi:hypothetical protein